MCGLFGFSFYGKLKKNDNKTINPFSDLMKYLGRASTVRGTHATGIAYNWLRKMNIDKEPKSADVFNFYIPRGVKAAIGHTRRTTKGNQINNYNNHPFVGATLDGEFAFAHNGVLDNDDELRKEMGLPSTIIETDSYVAVQVLEEYNDLSPTSIKKMAEKVIGMFTFTMLDEKNTLYIVKNDSPFTMIHFPDLQMYIYASTEEILMEALQQWGPTKEIINGVLRGKYNALEAMQWIEPKPGDILMIHRDGTIEKTTFEPNERWSSYSYYGSQGWWARQQASYTSSRGSSPTYGSNVTSINKPATTNLPATTGTTSVVGSTAAAIATRSITEEISEDEYYFMQLVRQAEMKGVTEEEIKDLQERGFTIQEIEDMLWDGTIYNEINGVDLIEID